jgi:hypothetical protein
MMAIDAADITSGWYWAVDRDFLYDPSIVFVQPWADDELVVLHHGVERPDVLPEFLKRYEFVVRIETPDFRAFLPEAALEMMNLEIDVESLEIVDITTDLPQDGHRRRRH